jgi:hypothetical protein
LAYLRFVVLLMVMAAVKNVTSVYEKNIALSRELRAQ